MCLPDPVPPSPQVRLGAKLIPLFPGKNFGPLGCETHLPIPRRKSAFFGCKTHLSVPVEKFRPRHGPTLDIVKVGVGGAVAFGKSEVGFVGQCSVG